MSIPHNFDFHHGLLAAAFMMTMPMHVSAQPGSRGFGGPQGGGRGGLPGLRALDLTDAQRDEIRSVREQHHDPALAQQHRAARQALNEAIAADVVNESAIRGLAAQLALFEADAAVQRAYAHAAVLQILTPDQRAELTELQAQAEEFRERMRPRRREGQ